ncbi:MAG: ribonuclease P protein component [Deltaproteobacteria bacterium]|nr:ribonuclease P protein component [Deltaproteobacteria bacterium]
MQGSRGRAEGGLSAPRAVGSRRCRSGRFVVFLRRRPEAAPGRLGITASVRVGNAVRRNRIRRLIREAYRTEPTLFPAEHDVVVLVTTGEGEWTLQGVVEELARWKQPRAQAGPDRSPQAR